MTQSASSNFSPADFLKTLSTRPGVYRMLGAQNEILYVGKASDLKSRVSSYFNKNVSVKTQRLVAQIHNIDVTLTRTATEALLLESNLIKEHRPRYNILLRDDKSYPYIHVSTEQSFPRLTLYRGDRSKKGRYFGPYPSSGAVRETINSLQKIFKIRSCNDTFFKNRSRPCLQYQIKRCTAPCTGEISEAQYKNDVQHALLFLSGKSQAVIDDLIHQMDSASQALQYEQAAFLRDRISALRKIYEQQTTSDIDDELDIIACASEGAVACVQVFYIRNGFNLGNKSFFPRIQADTDDPEILSAFMAQYYLERTIPNKIIISHPIDDEALLTDALSQRVGHAIKISHSRRGKNKRWLEMAEDNARQAVTVRLSSRQSMLQRLELIQQLLQLETPPSRIECFDISHTQGEATVASCVVFDQQAMARNQYRRFNISGITPGDDYAAMNQALTRRYTRLKKEDAILPDILLIDGGKGQVAEAQAVLDDLQIDSICIVGVAKGAARIPGQETLIIPHLQKTVTLAPEAAELHLIQLIRDEAHRFAITGHRAQRAKKRTTSPLQAIKGLGAKRRQALLKHFGGLQGVLNANSDALSSVKGISARLAKEIYTTLHDEK